MNGIGFGLKRAVVLLSLGVAVLGCSGGGGGYDGPTGVLSGKATLGGSALPEGTVIQLIHGESGTAVSGSVAADGEYEISDIRVGEHAIGVSAPLSDGGEVDPDQLNEQIDDGLYEEPETSIPEKYQSPETSGLAVEIKEGLNEFDVMLE